MEGGRVNVAALEAVDGTPALDVKRRTPGRGRSRAH
jgi:hypothetical protein